MAGRAYELFIERSEVKKQLNESTSVMDFSSKSDKIYWLSLDEWIWK